MLELLPATLRFLEFFSFFSRFFPLKLVYFGTKSRKNIFGCYHSFCATDLNFGTKSNGGMKYSTLKTVIFASYWGSPLVQFSKFKNFLWYVDSYEKNISNFVSSLENSTSPIAIKHKAWTKCVKLCHKKPIECENICRSWK